MHLSALAVGLLVLLPPLATAAVSGDLATAMEQADAPRHRLDEMVGPPLSIHDDRSGKCFPQITCTGIRTDHNYTATEMAIEALIAGCNMLNNAGGMTGAQRYAQTEGEWMVYACNYRKGWRAPCLEEEIRMAIGDIEGKCGKFSGGYWWHPSIRKTYGIDHAGADWCTNISKKKYWKT